MRKKIVLGIVCLLLLIVGFLFVGPLTFGIKREVTIASPIFIVSGKITDLRNWESWHPVLKDLDTSSIISSPSANQVNSFLKAGNHLYTVLQVNPAYILIKDRASEKTSYQSFYAFPDSSGAFTRVVLIKLVPFGTWLKEKIFPGKETDTVLNSLKEYIEDPARLYGFPISIGQVADTLVMTKTITADNKRKIQTLHQLYNDIYEFASKNAVHTSTIRMANFHLSGHDSVTISAGIPVNKKGAEKKDISYLEMPPKGKMLIGKYEGPYKGLNKLYIAMEKFIRDKGLHKVAIPYERYLSNPVSSSDSLQMKIELYYPIY
ncbi:MAG TPA: hypothetical protein VMH01_17010 [Puia sp.]|nr:hypothetical protein [Puia sp.]